MGPAKTQPPASTALSLTPPFAPGRNPSPRSEGTTSHPEMTTARPRRPRAAARRGTPPPPPAPAAPVKRRRPPADDGETTRVKRAAPPPPAGLEEEERVPRTTRARARREVEVVVVVSEPSAARNRRKRVQPGGPGSGSGPATGAASQREDPCCRGGKENGETAVPVAQSEITSRGARSYSAARASEKSFPALSMFQEAKALFRQTAAPGRLTGRETEQAAIHQFLFRSVIERRPGSLYISGSPGTGKTASLNEVVATIKSSGSLRRKVVLRSINCMTLSGPRAIFPKIVEEIDGSAVDCRTAVGVLTDRFCGVGGKWQQHLFVLILDEIDCLLSKDQDVLYKLFEWPTLPNSRLVLVGIANALDLTDRFLPRLRAKGIEPQLLHFNPYDVKDIVNIISERLRGLVRGRDAVGGDKEAAEKPGDVPLMQTSAIEMCARKVAAASGDLRRAMDVCRQAIELVEAEYKRKVGTPASETPAERQKTAVNAKSQVSKGQRQRAPSEAATGVSDAPKASVSHVLRVLLSTTGPGGVEQKLRALSFQQKQVLAVFLLVKNRDVPRAAGAPLSGVSKIQSATESPSRQRDAVTVASLYDAYVSYASRRCFLPPVTRAEYSDIISCLETSGVFRLSGRAGRKGGASRPGTPRSNLATPTGGAGADDVAVTLGVHADDVHKMMTNACDPQPLLLKFYNLSRADDVVRLEMRDLEEKENAVDMMSAVG